MLEFRILSTSKFDDLKTTVTYKYYHCPSDNKRIHAHVKHETLKEINVCPTPPATNTDGVFASLQAGGVKCKSIKELNIGQILPFMHLSNDRDTISEYKLDIDPEYIADGDPDIRVINYQDDVDLGKNTWFSFDEGKTGRSHAVIFDSNNLIVSGTNEKDGLQLNAFEVDYPHMLGLENNVATIQVGRNSYEAGENHDLTIPDDFIVEFDAEFFSSKTGGFTIINKEAAIFRELIKIKPTSINESIKDSKEIIEHNLSVFVHFAQSAPIGSSLSALLGLNLPYINVELYKDDSFIFSKNAVRLPINALPEGKDLTFIKKIIETIKIFDIKNISIFKKAVFSNIEEGNYVVKIFRENPLFSKEREYIGYAIVNLEQDEKVHILCTSETIIKVKIFDQDNKPFQNAEVVLQKDNSNIAKNLTDEKGQATIKVPTSSEKYNFEVIYNGCVVYQEPVKLGLIQKVITPEKKISLQRHNLKLKVTDKWGQVPEIELNPTITIEKSDDAFKIHGQKIDDDEFIFTNLTPNLYQLSLSYKSFNLNKNIELIDNKELSLEFPAEYNVKFKIFDSRGMPFEDTKILIIRNDKKLVIQNQKSEINATIPPGLYQVKIFNNEELIGVRDILIYGEQNYDLITKNQPIYPTVITIFGFMLIIFSLIISCFKKDTKYFPEILVISLIIISIFLPWWGINGSTDFLQTSTKLYLIPNNIITITTTEHTIAGELSFMPDEFKQALFLMTILIIVGCFLLILNKFIKKTDRKIFYKTSKIFAIMALIGSPMIFIVSMYELSKVSIGSIIGSDYLDINVPGESQIHSILCNWGPNIGFYIYLTAICFLLIFILIKLFTNKEGGHIKNKQTIQHPLFGISIKNWFKLLEKNGRVDIRYFARGAFITFGSIFTAPASFLFKRKYKKEIRNIDLKNPPIIIIGHWRSGTTYLHELLSQDPQFCYVSLWNTMLPDSFLILEPAKKFLSNFLPKQRPMDEIKVEIDGPYEEEAAIAVLSHWSFFHCLHFERNAEEQYLKSIHFD